MEHKYDINSLENGFESLKEKDRVVGKYLEQANEMLPKDERFSFYLVKFGRCLKDNGAEGTSSKKRDMYQGKLYHL